MPLRGIFVIITVCMNLIRLDGVLWDDSLYHRAYCPDCRIEMDAYVPQDHWLHVGLFCEDCGKKYQIPRDIDEQKKYVSRKIEAKNLKTIKVINFDDEATPLAEDKVEVQNGHFVKSILTDSKVGKRLVIYAGEKGIQKKTQIFAEPEIKRLSFDHKDIHPGEIFIKVEATFIDGTKGSIQSDHSKKHN